MTPGRIVFRADAGLNIGTGHVMRCLTLADTLRDQGAETLFVTRAHQGHVISGITERGHQVETLPGNTGSDYGVHPAPPAHAGWLEAGWRDDAAATCDILKKTAAGWLIMDHYALDRHWQAEALPDGVRLMVLDDLADRPHVADLLLDQNAGRQAADYDGLVPEQCIRMIGPSHALLRPEFVRLRPQALARRDALESPQKLLITLGGIDKDNATGRILDVLAQAPAAQHMQVSVIMGPSAPHLAAVRAQARQMPIPTEVAVGVSDMGQRMMQADLCIGAAGSTAWERCALGLPTLQVVLADNQHDAATYMAAQGMALALPLPDAPDFAAKLEAGLADLLPQASYRALARRTATLTDGTAAQRIAETLLDRIEIHAH